MYKLYFSKTALKDAAKLKTVHLEKKCQALLEIIAKHPFASPPPDEQLVGDLANFYSRRINIQHRLIYEVDKKNKLIKILRMWSHYE